MKQVDGKYICNLNYMVYMGVLFVDVFINAFQTEAHQCSHMWYSQYFKKLVLFTLTHPHLCICFFLKLGYLKNLTSTVWHHLPHSDAILGFIHSWTILSQYGDESCQLHFSNIYINT